MNRLKKLRIESNKTQKDIADFLGITDVAYYYYESEKRAIDTATIKKLATFFNVSVDYILGNSDYRNEDDFLMKNPVNELSPSSEALITSIITEMFNSDKPMETLDNFIKVISDDKKEEMKTAILNRYNYIKEIKFANHNGLDTTGLDDDDIKEIEKQIEFLKFKKGLK